MSSLAEILHNKFKDYSNLKSIKISDDEVLYSDLNLNALKIASLINRLKLKNETIAVVGQRNFTAYFAILGIIYSGCNYTPISLKFNKKKILSILKECKIKMLIGTKAEINEIEKILISKNNSHFVKYIVHEASEKIDNKLLKFNYEKEKPLKEPIKSDYLDLLYILYTSGSTGKPKGVMVSNKNAISYLKALSHIWPIKPGFKASQFHEFSFDPSVSDLFFTWLNGGVLCVVPEEELMMPYEFIRRESIQIWSSVPTVFNFIFRLKLLTPNIFPSLNKIRFAGEPLQKELADACLKSAPNAQVENHYGPTESTVDVSRYAYNENDKNKNFHNSIIPIGKPLIGNTIRIIDKGSKILKDEEIGEIVYKGDQVSKGYLNDKLKTNLKFVKFFWDVSKETWYKSGDLGFFNKDGDLEYVGRIDSQIKIGGKRIELGEIEAAFNKYRKTRGIVIVPFKNKYNVVECLTAFTINKLENIDENYIRNDITQYIEKIFIPRKIIFIKKIPLTVSGKIDRKKLEEIGENHLKF